MTVVEAVVESSGSRDIFVSDGHDDTNCIVDTTPTTTATTATAKLTKQVNLCNFEST